MSKITSSFIFLLLIIGFSSVVYIWQSGNERKDLENQIYVQEEEIATLQAQLILKETAADDIYNGDVQGVTTQTGSVLGTLSISKDINSKALIICAKQIHSEQETCTDIIIENNIFEYDYELELPQGKYEVYVVTPPSETKTYYSDISECDENGNCVAKENSKRLLEVVQEETQSNIDISIK